MNPVRDLSVRRLSSRRDFSSIFTAGQAPKRTSQDLCKLPVWDSCDSRGRLRQHRCTKVAVAVSVVVAAVVVVVVAVVVAVEVVVVVVIVVVAGGVVLGSSSNSSSSSSAV